MRSIIAGATGSELWEKSVRLLLRSPDLVPSAKGETIELNNVLLKLAHPLKEPVLSDKYCFNQSAVEKQFNPFVDNTYLRQGGGVDQLEYVYQELLRDFSSRRAITVLWNPEVDTGTSKPQGCIVLAFLVRNQKLSLTAFFRSVDAWSALNAHFFTFPRIQKMVSEEVNRRGLSTTLGPYHELCLSLHLYLDDLPEARSVFNGE